MKSWPSASKEAMEETKIFGFFYNFIYNSVRPISYGISSPTSMKDNFKLIVYFL